MNLKLRRWLLFIVWILITFYLSRQNGVESARLSNGIADWLVRNLAKIGVFIETKTFGFYLRKTAHFMFHLVLAVLCYRAVRTTASSAWLSFAIALVISAAFAVINEVSQLFAAGRFATETDAFINLTGAAVGTILAVPTVREI